MTSDDEPVDVPDWDVALAALAREEFTKRNDALTIEDFRRLANAHAIRFDDIMATMFELVIQGEWRYEDAPGRQHAISRDDVNELYVHGRLNDSDVAEYTGYWLPAK